jgi:hypothetical protein
VSGDDVGAGRQRGQNTSERLRVNSSFENTQMNLSVQETRPVASPPLPDRPLRRGWRRWISTGRPSSRAGGASDRRWCSWPTGQLADAPATPHSSRAARDRLALHWSQPRVAWPTRGAAARDRPCGVATAWGRVHKPRRRRRGRVLAPQARVADASRSARRRTDRAADRCGPARKDWPTAANPTAHRSSGRPQRTRQRTDPSLWSAFRCYAFPSLTVTQTAPRDLT